MSAAAAPANSIAAIPRRLREQVLRLIPQDSAKLRAPALGERVGIGIIIHTSARRAMPSVRIAHSPVFSATAYARRSLDKSEAAEAIGRSRAAGAGDDGAAEPEARTPVLRVSSR